MKKLLQLILLALGLMVLLNACPQPINQVVVVQDSNP